MSSPAKLRAAELLELVDAQLDPNVDRTEAERTLEVGLAIALLLLTLVESVDDLALELARLRAC